MVTNDRGVLAARVGAALAWVAAALYVLMVLGVPYPDLGVQRVMFSLAAASYAAGGLLLWRGVGTRLLVAGAIANAVVMLVWLVRAATGGTPADAFALGSKVVELALEVVLVAALRTRSSTTDIARSQEGTTPTTVR